MHVSKQPFSESALRVSLNSCILLAHIRRKNVSPICGKKSQCPKWVILPQFRIHYKDFFGNVAGWWDINKQK